MVADGQRITCPPQVADVKGVPKKTWVPYGQIVNNDSGYIYVQPDITYAKIRMPDGTFMKAKTKNEKFRFTSPQIPKASGGKVTFSGQGGGASSSGGSSSGSKATTRSLPSSSGTVSPSRGTPSSASASASSRSSSAPSRSPSAGPGGSIRPLNTQESIDMGEAVSPVVIIQARSGQSLEDINTYRGRSY